jgi:ABC-2 type transport system ATP-binding protein
MAPAPAPAIEAHGLVKTYGRQNAVDGLDLAVPEGCFYGLLGPNGAGKSTTIGLLTGMLRPTAGTIRIQGRVLDPDDPGSRLVQGVVPEEPPLFERLTGAEQLVFTARMYGLSPDEARTRTLDLLRLLSLAPAAAVPVADYSRGMKKKLAFAGALLHAPRILFLDEPFEGVDPQSGEVLRRLLAALVARGATVLFTTHILEVAERLCERVGILHRGRLAEEVDLAALRATGGSLHETFTRAVGAGDGPLDLPAWLAP